MVAGWFTLPAAAVERVIFCATPAGACAGAGRTLGKSEAGAWVEIDDADLIANSAQTQQLPPVLYFSRAAYDQALAGLSKREKEQAILKQARDKASRPHLGLVERVYDDCVDLAIAAGGDADAVAVSLEAATILAGGAESNADVPLPQVLDRVIESLAKLRAELPDSGAAAAGYRAEAEALDDVATGRRGGEGSRSFPIADPERVYFIPGEKVARGFDGELPELQAYGWNGGAISAMSPADAAAIKGPRPKLLYYSNRAFLTDKGSLTEAQFDRRLRARLRGAPAGERAALAARLAFEHAVTVRQYGATLQRRAPDSLAPWNEIMRGDDGNLRRVLSAVRVPGGGAKTARARLRADVALAEFALRTGPDPNLITIERVDAVLAKLAPDD
jgi:hypothetical protein